ncbi:MAG: NAD(P)-dependent oxidoreductase [Lentisphaeria bacterium]
MMKANDNRKNLHRVLVTGAAGFIGSYVVEEFAARGFCVTGMIHNKESLKLRQLATENENVELVNGDVCCFNSLRNIICSLNQGCLTIVHCAGRASDVGRRRAFRKTNFESVQHLITLVKQEDVERLVFVSTTDVYGLQDSNGQAEDELPLKAVPANPYPEFKIQAETIIRKQLPANRFAILRPAQVWGTGDTTLTPRILDFLRWSPWIVHFGRWGGRNRWPLAHVRNVALAAYLVAGGAQTGGKAVNVLDSEYTTVDDFYRIMAQAFFPCKKFKTVTIPFWAGEVFGAMVSGISNFMNLKEPFLDPSRYALYAVSKNLDFSNRRLVELTRNAGEKLMTRDEGICLLQN